MLKNELEIAKLLNIPDLQAKIEAVEVVDTLCGVDFCPVQDNGASKKDKVETGRLAKSSSASRLRVAKLLGVPEHYVHVVSPAQDIPDEMLSPKEIGCLWGGISKSEVNKNLQTLNLQVFLDGHWVPTSEGARMSEIAITENRKGHFYRWNYLALEEKYREKLQNLR